MSPSPPEILVPRLDLTDRLVERAPLQLSDARNGAVPRLRTAVRAGLRGRTLCIRFDGRDDGIVASLTRRDDPLWREDVVEVFLSPHPTPRIYYEFEVNPLGTLFDARVESPELRRSSMHVDPAWDCPGFEATVQRRPRRWSALLRIPLDPLCGGEPPPLWRANFYRIDRGAVDELTAWSPTLLDPPDFHVPERFGVLKLELAQG